MWETFQAGSPSTLAEMWVAIQKPVGVRGPMFYYAWWDDEAKTFEGQPIKWDLDETDVVEWQVHYTPNGKPYYHNKYTMETCWKLHMRKDRASQATWRFTVSYRSGSMEEALGRPRAVGVRRPTHDSPNHAWVLARCDDGTPSFFNYCSQEQLRILPAGVNPSFKAFQAPDGGTYFQNLNTHATSWELPEENGALPSSRDEVCRAAGLHHAWWIVENGSVMIKGLTSHTRYNGRNGTIVGFRGGQVVVMLCQQLGSPHLYVSPFSVGRLQEGTKVYLQDLQADAVVRYNGRTAEITAHDDNKGRYVVSIQPIPGEVPFEVKSVAVLPTKVRAVPHLIDLDLTNVPVYGPTWPAGEQSCVFIRKSGQQHKYFVRLPVGFRSEEGRKWPVIFYMHGNGGRSGFYDQGGKKGKSTVGFHFVTREFIVVSPLCEWNWKAEPMPWVLDLVEEFTAASYVDHTRVYICGCSMGGMSTLEFSAARPELFAAVAPVFAYHHAGREERLARALMSKPILSVQSASDPTCPLPGMRSFWEKIQAMNPEGNLLQINTAPNICHGDGFSSCFCDSTFLYEWLLQFEIKDFVVV